jgi:adenylylsulfate kinase
VIPTSPVSSLQHSGLAVWFTGLSGSGKTTLCRAVAAELHTRGENISILDGDELRRTLTPTLGFTREDREANIHRMASLAEDLIAQQTIALIAAIAPYRSHREAVRRRIPSLIEVYVNAPLAICIQRDPKGLYRRALAGEIPCFTGISDPYEPPLRPDVECSTAVETIPQSAAKVLAAITLHLNQHKALHAAR